MGLKIDGGSSGRKPQAIGSKTGKETVRVQDKSAAQFGSHLGRHFGDAQEETLKQMAKDIEKQGEHLAERIDISELKTYKRMVMEFLDEAVRGFGRFSKESFLDRRGRHRVFATVKTVNDTLEELTREFLKTEKDNLTIISKIEDIRGLILDLII
jgi:uncharacterized protein YaaR (DUF327 family)